MTCLRASVGGGKDSNQAKTALILKLALDAALPFRSGMPDVWLHTDIIRRGLKHVWAEFTVQLVECLSDVLEALGSVFGSHKPGVMVHICVPVLRR